MFAFEGKTCVGRSILTLCVFNNHTALIADLFVREEFRQRGYGLALTKECLEVAKAFSLIKIVKIVDGSDHGETRRIAAKLGFESDGEVFGRSFTYKISP